MTGAHETTGVHDELAAALAVAEAQAAEAEAEAAAQAASVDAAGFGPASAAGRADAPVTITAYPNGPLLVRGSFEILTPAGTVIPPGRKTVALCRCGVSTLKPFCDGSHKAIGFRTEPEPPEAHQAL